MNKAPISSPSLTSDFWPASSLQGWATDPLPSFTTWLAERRINGGRHFRESTIDTYQAMFTSWLEQLQHKSLSLLEATPSDALEFFDEKNLEPVSRRRYLQLLNKVYEHLNILGWSGHNPLRLELASERILDVPLPEGLAAEDKDKLIQHLAAQNGWKASRDRAVIALLMGAGLRSNEAIHLTLSELSAHPIWTVQINPRGVHRSHQSLVLPEGPWRGWISEWLVDRAQMEMPGDLMCPATPKGLPYSTSGLFRRLEGLATAAGMASKQGGANVLRNTFARDAFRCERYSIEEIQEFLGHEDTRATGRHMV